MLDYSVMRIAAVLHFDSNCSTQIDSRGLGGMGVGRMEVGVVRAPLMVDVMMVDLRWLILLMTFDVKMSFWFD